jgi:hypothetical protein
MARRSALQSVVSIYPVRELDLPPLELLLIGTEMQAALFAFEVLNGVLP